MKTLNKILLYCSYMVAAIGLYLVIKSVQSDESINAAYLATGAALWVMGLINVFVGRFTMWSVLAGVFGFFMGVIPAADLSLTESVVISVFMVMSMSCCYRKAAKVKRIG